MRISVAWMLVACLGTGLLLGVRLPTAAQAERRVRPARVEPMQNLEVEAARSRRPAYLPPEWGRLVAVEKTGNVNYTLFLAADNGEIYVVRLIQSGDYLYLDTYDNGGVALVLQREP